jgi:hypothetical protein
MKLKLILSVASVVALIAGPAVAKQSPNARGEHNRVTTQPVLDLQGRVIGADPDLRIRFELARDAFASYN